MNFEFLKNAKDVGKDGNVIETKPKAEETAEVKEEQNNNDAQQEVPNTDNKDEKRESELQSQGEGQSEQDEVQSQEVVQEVDIDDDKVLSYLKEKGIEVSDFEELKKPKQETEIPSELKSYLDYKKETNRSYQDFLELQKDWKNESEDVVLKKYLKEKNPYFTDQDINDELSEYKINEDLDEDNEIRKKERNKKKLLNEAVSFLESQKEQYKTPLEGSSDKEQIVPDEYKEAKTKLSEINRLQQEQQDLAKQRQQAFLNESKNKVFNEEFKGFEFEVEGQKKLFKAGEANELFEKQSDIMNVLKPFFNEKGEVVDHKGYHKFINAGLNADKIAKHFYELGKSETVANVSKESKNINLSGHRVDSNEKPNGIKFKVVNQQPQRGYIIKR